jgi:GNAT superfamily N-acetyltransferase
LFFCERIRPDHDLAKFASGHGDLDAWLRKHAVHSDATGTARTYVWLDEEGDVSAYYSLTPHLVRRAELSVKQGRGSPDAIPAILLARLALDRALQGTGLGSVLVADALGIAVEAIRKAGGRLIVVDAIDERAAGFYAHHGFTPVPENPHRLVLKARTAARSLGLEWP